MNADQELLRFEGITKTFGKVQALSNVSFSLMKNEVLGLVGDNGAGKSTLIKVLAGIHQPEQGTITIDGEEVRISNPKVARRHGIEFVHQDIGLAKDLEVRRNMFLGEEPISFKLGPLEFLDLEKMTRETRRGLSERIGILSDINPLSPVHNLSGGERQAVKLGRAIYHEAQLIVLDEPIRALSIREKKKIRELIEELNRDKQITFIYITHNINEVYPLADRFVILERGRKIAEVNKEEVTVDEIETAVATGRFERG